jgi:hypothetical protein
VALCFAAYQNETKRPVFALRARRVIVVLLVSAVCDGTESADEREQNAAEKLCPVRADDREGGEAPEHGEESESQNIDVRLPPHNVTESEIAAHTRTMAMTTDAIASTAAETCGFIRE